MTVKTLLKHVLENILIILIYTQKKSISTQFKPIYMYYSTTLKIILKNECTCNKYETDDHMTNTKPEKKKNNF